MPCIIITGHPSSGKSTVAKLLKERALKHAAIDDVVLINEESEFGTVDNDRRSLYETAALEKATRGTLKSAFDRAVGSATSTNNNLDNDDKKKSRRRRLIILDSLNYIKGYRYELYCISKAAQEVHGILWVLNKPAVVQEWNSRREEKQGYPPALLQELMQRYEPPDERNRWDRPLFTVDLAAAAAAKSDNGMETSRDVDSTLENLLKESAATTKSELLQQSVYNMHRLGDALVDANGTDSSSTQPTMASNNNNNHNQTEASAATPITEKRPTKSAFKRAPKKKTPQPQAEGTTVSITTTPKPIIAYTPDDLMMTPAPEPSTMAAEHSSLKQHSLAASTTTTPAIPANLSLGEQLDCILDALLQTKALKEGISTQQHVPGQAIGWKVHSSSKETT
jgi:tRNA uridine 5-carbamoylmethylation protein Kti12